MAQFFAAIGTHPTVVGSDFCDLIVTEATLVGYRAGEDGDVEEYGFGGDSVLDAVDLPVRTDDDDAHAKIGDAADEMLAAHGFRRVGSWEASSDAYYAEVERLSDPEVTWSVVRGESPNAHAVEPAPNGISIPGRVLDWAARHGLRTDDPGVYLLVTLADEAGEVPGEIAYMSTRTGQTDADRLRAALDALPASA